MTLATERRIRRSSRASLITLSFAALALPGVAQSDPEFDGWNRPVVTELELSWRGDQPDRDRDRGSWGRGRDRDRDRDREVGQRVTLDTGESVEVNARGVDQSGARFPADRFAIGVAFDSRCESVTIDNRRADGFRLVAGNRRGVCDVTVWVPGNLNLDRTIRVEVGGRDDRGRAVRNGRDRDNEDGWSRAEAERIAHRLYNSILVRVPDPDGLRDTIVEIQAGRLDQRIEQMVKSAEFRRRRSSAQEFINEYYRGLLHREPDTAGVRVYLDDVKRGRHVAVVLAIVRSDEFVSQVRDK